MKEFYFYKLQQSLLAIGSILLCINIFSCNRFIAIEDLKDNLLSSDVFNNEATANNALAGIYETMKDTYSSPSVSISVQAGLCADELQSTLIGNTFQNNSILSTDALPWGNQYKIIYQCNAAIEGLTNSSLTAEIKDRLTGEAKFLRAYNYFYLVNLFGDVPLILTTDVNKNAFASRSTISAVNAQILKDLLDAEVLLPEINIYAMGEKIRANRSTTRAMLARVYTYQKDWSNAWKYADMLIQGGEFRLNENLADVFKKNSEESILQIANNETQAIDEVSTYTPNASNTIANVLTVSLLNAFEFNDKRRTQWIDSFVYLGSTVYYPAKYSNPSVNPPEYYVLLRLSEMYLIRAEANAMQNKFELAAADVNFIRLKHGGLLAPLKIPSDMTTCIDMILHERRVELFVEGGHRWFDLKRTGKVDAVISAEKPGKWNSTAALWPIPFNDLQRDQSLQQNPGYQ